MDYPEVVVIRSSIEFVNHKIFFDMIHYIQVSMQYCESEESRSHNLLDSTTYIEATCFKKKRAADPD
jgi:hypothetical protein